MNEEKRKRYFKIFQKQKEAQEKVASSHLSRETEEQAKGAGKHTMLWSYVTISKKNNGQPLFFSRHTSL